MTPRVVLWLSSLVLALLPRVPADTGPGAGGESIRAWKGLSRAAPHPLREREFVSVGAWAPRDREGSIPPRPQLADIRGVEQLLGPQQHPVPHLEHRVDPARVELRLSRLLRRSQELAHRA